MHIFWYVIQRNIEGITYWCVTNTIIGLRYSVDYHRHWLIIAGWYYDWIAELRTQVKKNNYWNCLLKNKQWISDIVYLYFNCSRIGCTHGSKCTYSVNAWALRSWYQNTSDSDVASIYSIYYSNIRLIKINSELGWCC